MRFKLFLLAAITAAASALAQNAQVRGTVVDAYTGAPLSGATVMLRGQGLTATSGPAGDFLISKAKAGQETLLVVAYGYNDGLRMVELFDNQTVNVGQIGLSNADVLTDYYDDQADMLFDEAALDDEESTAQSIAALTGASDNIYYNASNYNFSTMYFRFRGYDSQYQTTYINGMDMNDPIRGRFNFSSLGGMTSRAFRNRTNSIGLSAAGYGFGNVGGSSNISTITSEYAPGFNGSVAYTNSNYMLRAMATYSTGINEEGWGLTVSAIGRWANEGVVEGTFYNSVGLFVSGEKVFNKHHSLTLTAYGAPTQRATSSPTYQEAFDLVGSNLYNPNWGYQNGKKRSAKIVESFDPTIMFNYIYKNDNTTVNTGLMARVVNYSSSALNWYNALDPNPAYYRNLPSNFYDNGEPTAQSEYVAEQWRTNEAFRQINWDNLYAINYLNNYHNSLPENADNQLGSSYILEDRHSNNVQGQLSTVLNHRISSTMSLQGGASVSYTKANYYKTIRDLLGGEFWVDIDPFSDRDFTIAPTNLQNDLDNPDRIVHQGDTFGYDYDIHAIKASGWLQNTITLPRWDINYGMTMSYTQFWRDGHMRNGRAPFNSKGRGTSHRFDNATVKAGATYKIDGRNYIMAHAEYGSQAPLIESVYISPRIKDTTVNNPQSERILSGDLTYGWNFRRFRGSVTGYWTEFYDAIERTAFYDDNYSCFTNYVLSGVRRCYKGVEVGMAFKITPSLTLSAAGTYASYRYKNNPNGTRSFENGLYADTTQVIYLNNLRVGGTPQTAVNVGIDWAAPHSWFFGINGSWMGNAYVKLAPAYHEALADLWKSYPDAAELQAKIEEISTQGKMNNAFVLNVSIGKLIYLNRKMSMNINLNVDNVLNNRNIMNNAYQQGRIDSKYGSWDMNKYPNKYSYSQGIKVFLNCGIRF